MITVNNLRKLFDDTWFVLKDENGRDVFVERDSNEHDISEFDKCEVKLAYPSEDEVRQIVCQIYSSDPNYPKKRRYRFNGTWTYVVEANSVTEAERIIHYVRNEELLINDGYDITEIKD